MEHRGGVEKGRRKASQKDKESGGMGKGKREMRRGNGTIMGVVGASVFF